MKRVEGKVAIVTGSTYGIGEAIEKVLAKEGAISIITGRTREEGRRSVESIFKQIKGVIETTVGYTGGTYPNQHIGTFAPG
jgi:NAD(P)-dependent dehydrogenase (short-subunit alcohol dehydrogenase family)